MSTDFNYFHYDVFALAVVAAIWKV